MTLPLPDVARFLAPDREHLSGLLLSESAATLWSTCSNGQVRRVPSGGDDPLEPGIVLSIAASEVSELERARLLIEKAGLAPAAEELRAKQGVFVRVARGAGPERVALLFSGQGSQYPGMMRRLADELPEAAEVARRADAWLASEGLPPISPVMFSGAPIPSDVFTIQAAVLVADLMAFEVARCAGGEIAVVTGHSYGDYAALVAAGVFSLEGALFATRVRSRAITSTSVPGGMTSVPASLDEVERLLREARSAGPIQVANINAADQIVVAGAPPALERLERLAARSGVEAVRLDVPRAFHSALMASARPRLADGLARLPLSPPRVPFLSSVTGRLEEDPEVIRAALVDQLTRPVEFVRQVRSLRELGANVLIECGPRGVLASLVKRTLKLELERGDDVAVGTTDDALRPGRFAVARLRALLDCRRRAVAARSAGQAPRAVIAAIGGERARALLAEPGFEGLWAEVRPAIARLVESLFHGESGEGSAAGRVEAAGLGRSGDPHPASPASPSLEVELARVDALALRGPEGAGLTPVDEVMRRFVARSAPAPLERSRGGPWPDGQGGRAGGPPVVALLAEPSSERARAISAALSSRGAEVLLGASAERLVERVRAEAGGEVHLAGVILEARRSPAGVERGPAEAPGGESAELEHGGWEDARARLLVEPFRFLRALAPLWSSERPVRPALFGVTCLGGAMGADNAREGDGAHGGLAGLMKAIRRELAPPRAFVLDTSPTDPPRSVAEAVLEELDAGAPRFEVGRLRGRRLRLVLAERPARPTLAAERLPRAWLLTGGARGVTAKLAERLAELYRPRLHLVGRQVLPPPAELDRLRALDAAALAAEKRAILESLREAPAPGEAPLALRYRARCEALDKVLEIDATLGALTRLGSEVEYHAADVADPSAVARVLAHARARGPIEGLIHAAGVEHARRLEEKDDHVLSETIGAKVDGLVNLLAALEHEPLRVVAGFSSVSGRFGGHGQADYSMANEALARILSQHRARRPDRRVVCLAWPAFGEVGLAMRSSSRLFLERAGQRFMSPAEGANHLIRELWAGLPEHEVVIWDGSPALSLDDLLPSSEAQWAERDARGHAAARAPLLGPVVEATATGASFEVSLDAGAPFLDQHRMGSAPILPAVAALELFAEATRVMQEPGGGAHAAPVEVLDVEIEEPMKLSPGGAREARVVVEHGGGAGRVGSSPEPVAAQALALALTSHVLRRDGVVLDPHRTFVRGKGRILREEELDRALQAAVRSLGGPVAAPREQLLPYPYLATFDSTPGSRVIFHGAVFRVVEGVLATGSRSGVALLSVPPPGELLPGAAPEGWELPVALLDGCLQAAGMLGRLLFGRTALPRGFGRVLCRGAAALQPGERLTLQVAFEPGPTGGELTSRMVAHADRGPVLALDPYRATVLPG